MMINRLKRSRQSFFQFLTAAITLVSYSGCKTTPETAGLSDSSATDAVWIFWGEHDPTADANDALVVRRAICSNLESISRETCQPVSTTDGRQSVRYSMLYEILSAAIFADNRTQIVDIQKRLQENMAGLVAAKGGLERNPSSAALLEKKAKLEQWIAEDQTKLDLATTAMDSLNRATKVLRSLDGVLVVDGKQSGSTMGIIFEKFVGSYNISAIRQKASKNVSDGETSFMQKS